MAIDPERLRQLAEEHRRCQRDAVLEEYEIFVAARLPALLQWVERCIETEASKGERTARFTFMWRCRVTGAVLRTLIEARLCGTIDREQFLANASRESWNAKSSDDDFVISYSRDFPVNDVIEAILGHLQKAGFTVETSQPPAEPDRNISCALKRERTERQREWWERSGRSLTVTW